MPKQLIFHDNVGFNNEAITSVAFDGVTITSAVLFSYDLTGKLQTGDYLKAFGTFEVTNNGNDEPNTILVGKQIFLCASPTDTAGTQLTPGNGTNLTIPEHHGTQTDAGAITIPSFIDGPFLNYILFADGALADSPLTVNQGYGNMYLEIHREVNPGIVFNQS